MHACVRAAALRRGRLWGRVRLRAAAEARRSEPAAPRPGLPRAAPFQTGDTAAGAALLRRAPPPPPPVVDAQNELTNAVLEGCDTRERFKKLFTDLYKCAPRARCTRICK